MLTRYRQRGLTLIELMLAGTLALIALAAVMTVYAATAHHSRLQLQSAHLHQQMRGILQLIGRDLRRAGYWRFDALQQSAADNPFQRGDNRLRTGAYPDQRPGSCILLAYDLDDDGRVGVGRCAGAACPPFTDDDNVEQFGFRLRNGAVQSRYGGTALGCDTGYWQALNDSDIDVTRLHFTLYTHCVDLAATGQACNLDAPRLFQFVVKIDLVARLRRQPHSETTLTGWIRLRNDRLVAPPP